MKKRGYPFWGMMVAAALLLTACYGRKEQPYTEADAYSYTENTEMETVVSLTDTVDTKEPETENMETESLEPSISQEKYAYQTLNEEEKRVYDQIYQTLMGHIRKVTVDTLDTDVLEHAYRAVQADYGGIFWVMGYSYTKYTQGEELISIDFAPNYTRTEEERAGLQEQINEATGQILLGIDSEASDYEKAKYVFDYLASEVEYKTDAPDNQNIISVFLNHETVCQGYASAMQYLLNQLKIQSAVVTGTANGQSHAWNLVKLDGAYYYMDVTWGNSSYTGEDGTFGKFINYNYFAVTSADMAKTHTPDASILLPECDATVDNYYVQEGRYISEWDPDVIGALFREGYEGERKFISVKFDTGELYQQCVDYFIDEQHIMDYCSGLSELQYLVDDDQQILTVKF